MAQFLYDRVAVYVDGQEYLPQGQIRSFSMDVTYNSKQAQTMTPSGISGGVVIGNKSIRFRWDELFPQAANYVNWRTFLIANPNTQITIVPISLATGVPEGAEFVITGIAIDGMSPVASGEGNEMTRSCSFNAQDSSNT